MKKILLIILLALYGFDIGAQSRPSVTYHSTGEYYNINDLVSLDGVIYKALSLTNSTPPNSTWEALDSGGSFDASLDQTITGNWNFSNPVTFGNSNIEDNLNFFNINGIRGAVYLKTLNENINDIPVMAGIDGNGFGFNSTSWNTAQRAYLKTDLLTAQSYYRLPDLAGGTGTLQTKELADASYAPISTTGSTNLTYTPSPTLGIIDSDTGTNASIPLVDDTNSGLMSPTQKAAIALNTAKPTATEVRTIVSDSLTAAKVDITPTQITYSSIMTTAYTPTQPNRYLIMAGDGVLEITGTLSHGASGILDIYGTGTLSLVNTDESTLDITISASQKTVFFRVNKDDDLIWYQDENTSPTPTFTLPYDNYVALISQTGTADPTAIVLENTLGDIVWTRNSIGTYYGTLTSAFPSESTFVLIQDGYLVNNCKAARFNDNQVLIISRDADNANPIDGINSGSLEIRVYPSDTEDPTAPTSLVASNITDETIDLDWTAATDNVAVTGYNLYIDGVLDSDLGNVTSHTVTGLTPSTEYDFNVTAYDAIGNESVGSNTVTETTLSSITPFEFNINTNSLSAGSNDAVTFQFPLNSSSLIDGTIDWGDGNTNVVTSYDDVFSGETLSVAHTYASGGDYNVTFTGTLSGWAFNGSGDRNKMRDVSSWGNLVLNREGGFKDCALLTVSATDLLTIIGEGSKSAFSNTDAMTSINVTNFNMTNATDAAFMFANKTSLNLIGEESLDMQNIVSLAYFISNTGGTDTNFNPSLWDISSLTSAVGFMSLFNLTTTNYDSLLINYLAQSPNSGINFYLASSTYTQGLVDSGTTDSTTASKLIDSTQNFITTVSVNDVIHNTTNDTYATVTAIDDDTTLSLSHDIMTSGDTYEVETSAAAIAKEQLVNDYGWVITDAGGI